MTSEKKSLFIKTAADTVKLFLIIMVVVMVISRFQLSFLFGLTVGTLISILNYYLLVSSVDIFFERNTKSILFPAYKFIIRFVIIGAGVCLSLKYKNIINLYTLVGGITLVHFSMILREISMFNKHLN